MGIQNKSHSYNFTISGYKTSVDELIEELKKARETMGGNPVVSFSYYAGDQREPSTLTVKVTAQ